MIGSLDYGALVIRPEARLNWMSEESDAYRDGLGVDIPTIRSSIGTLDLGPEFRWTLETKDDSNLEVSLGFAGIWAFDQSLDTTANLQVERILFPEFRGRAKAGAMLTSENGVVVWTDIVADGIGSNDYNSLGGAIGIRFGF